MYEPTATGFDAPSTVRIASSVRARAGSRESARRSISASAGSANVKNRRLRDSGDRSWKKRLSAGMSSGRDARSIATDPSRRTTRSAASSAAGSDGVETFMSGLRDCHERVRTQELSFGMPYGEHGTRRNANHALGHTAHQQVRDGAAAV